MRICVFCASSAKIDKVYFDAAERLAAAFAKAGVEVVYGGGAAGLMGVLADTMLKHGGKIKGILPKFMVDVEWEHKGVSDMIMTDTMHERKARFLENVDALVALPGGCGTLEELLEAITLKRLGQFTKPIVILNTKGYYNPLLEMFEKAVKENFMKDIHLDMWKVVTEPEEVLDAIKNSKPWDKGAINFAAVR
ncbi:MAG TPA: TIGR00730 family Rossman fold protein [Ignavibacteria bacterium]|nr:TIGR00730 family Rossman fold protein [Ignavibacteria bacterium]